jgi:hypothetical protein
MSCADTVRAVIAAATNMRKIFFIVFITLFVYYVPKSKINAKLEIFYRIFATVKCIYDEKRFF